MVITLRQLLSNTGGIRASNPADLYSSKLVPCANVTETVSFFAKDALIAKPGTKFVYSNFGFSLVGAIIESVVWKAYGKTFETYCNEFYQKKLNMARTLAERRELILPNRARYYNR